MPGFLLGSYFIILPVSVVAAIIFLFISFGSSNKAIVVSKESVFDIFLVGSARLIIFAPSFGSFTWGTLNVSPNL